MGLIWALVLITALVTGEGVAWAEPNILSRSAELGAEITAATAQWCSSRPTFRVSVPDVAVFGTLEFTQMVARLGNRLVAPKCPSAGGIALAGVVRGEAGIAWRGSADAASGWTLLVEPDLEASRRVEVAISTVLPGFDADRHCWPAAVRDLSIVTSACLRVAQAFVAPALDRTPLAFVLLEGDGAQSCHACAGLAAFAVLGGSGAGWVVYAPPVPMRSGGYGKPNDPGNITFARLGANMFGWIERQFVDQQGSISSKELVRVNRFDAIVVAGTLPGGSSNRDMCLANAADRPPGCDRPFDVSIDAVVDSSDPSLPAYPIRLRSRGVDGSSQVDRRSVVVYDPDRGRYGPPGDLP